MCSIESSLGITCIPTHVFWSAWRVRQLSVYVDPATPVSALTRFSLVPLRVQCDERDPLGELSQIYHCLVNPDHPPLQALSKRSSRVAHPHLSLYSSNTRPCLHKVPYLALGRSLQCPSEGSRRRQRHRPALPSRLPRRTPAVAMTRNPGACPILLERPQQESSRSFLH